MTDAVQPASSGENLTPRRIRHITGVQIRNLTPFPFRDAFTSALSHPVEQSHFGSTSDDLGVILSRKRSRKLSTNSTATRLGLKWEDGVHEQRDLITSSVRRGRAASTSTNASLRKRNTSNSPSTRQSFSSPRSTQSLRAHRARTNSVTSSASNHFANSAMLGPSSSSLSVPRLFPDNSQAALEKIIASRMVETFITISLPITKPPVKGSHPTHVPSTALHPPNGLNSASTQRQNGRLTSGTRKISSNLPSTSDSSRSTLNPKTRSPPLDSATSANTRSNEAPGLRKQDLRLKAHLTPPSKGSISISKLSPQTKEKHISTHPPETENLAEDDPDPPIYFSPTHRPSTNPFFSIDARSGRDFLQLTETSGDRLKVDVWGRILNTGKRDDLKKKWQHRIRNATDGSQHGWKLLDEWNISLNDLVPLPKDLDINPSHLPSNTILITLSPPGDIFYLPTSTTTFSRSSTPSLGYTSDPESEIRKAKHVDQHFKGTPVQSTVLLPLSKRRHRHTTGTSVDSKDGIRSAGWAELFKLVTFQSCILDNEASQSEVVRKIDGLLEDDTTFPLKRGITEREARIMELTANHSILISQSAKKKKEIQDRTQRLQLRGELLDSARLALEFNVEIERQIEDERIQLTFLRQRLRSLRTNLLSILSTIFPIELLSPPDLLFTILDVPLPIPITPSDPAPPLALPEHKDVTEEAVATALGYVAQTLQILAAYTGQALVYPVTCVGSRSLIKDCISGMVGPRMFPLFSRGVDTYRFEYGVFLLNKDLEMLMSERDLRALDIRHTLPNLKNLLLTLSHDSSQTYQPMQRVPSPVPSIPASEAPSDIEIENDIQTPKASRTPTIHTAPEGMTPTASGATTPTTAALSDESSKARSFLGFVPFTDFLRARYPSTSQSPDKTLSKSHSATVSVQVGDFEGDASLNGGAEPDQADRITIHADKGP